MDSWKERFKHEQCLFQEQYKELCGHEDAAAAMANDLRLIQALPHIHQDQGMQLLLSMSRGAKHPKGKSGVLMDAIRLAALLEDHSVL